MNAKMKDCLSPSNYKSCSNWALLFLRLVAGAAFVLHGWGKMQTPFGWMPAESPIPGVFQGLAAFAEFGGGIAWILGLLTPLASLGIAITMGVATFFHMVILKDPFVASGPGTGSYELALVYFAVAIVLMKVGPGSISLDAKIFGKK